MNAQTVICQKHPDVKIINHQETNEIINDKVICLLKMTLHDVDTYIQFMRVLWSVRELIVRGMDEKTLSNSELRPLFHVINEIIGILCASKVGFDAFIKRENI